VTLERQLEPAREFLGAVGESFAMTSAAARSLLRRPLEWPAAAAEFEHLIVGSLPLTALVGLFTGMVFALETAYSLSKFGAKLYVAEGVALSICRELGPVLTGIVAGGRIGAGITATIGSMTVTEQVDAIRALGASPAKKLMLPRLIACLIGLPLLTIFADGMGLMGGFVISVFDLQLPAQYTMAHLFSSLLMRDYFEGVAKAVPFALAIVMVSVHQGLHVRGGASGVGMGVTRTVAITCVLVLVLDFFLTKFFLFF
jgi:phospholipid/cholesterol/gamma-HCH transport system permease protein